MATNTRSPGQVVWTSISLQRCHGIETGLRTRRANIYYGKDYSKCRESRVRTEIRLQFSRHSLLYVGILKAPRCLVWELVATDFSEHTRSQTEYDMTAIRRNSVK